MNSELKQSVDLLSRLVATPSFSRDEGATAALLESHLAAMGARVSRVGNNVVARRGAHDPSKPVVMLNSHHDTVKPSAGYTRNPFEPLIEEGRLYGLGSNDAGGSVVALAAAFGRLLGAELPFNLVLALTAEEEVSGAGGVRALLPAIEPVDMAIVGEPTGLDAAVGERGLMVLDCTARGVSGHAARNSGVNALYRALDDIARLRSLEFGRESELMGPVNINVTMISAGTQHNVVPDSCTFVADVRTTDAYTNEETLAIIRSAVSAEVTPRSTHIRASALGASHPLARAAAMTGLRSFLSPTTSDMALMPFPTLKIGPGLSERSHRSDEFIEIAEIAAGIATYSDLLDNLASIINSH